MFFLGDGPKCMYVLQTARSSAGVMLINIDDSACVVMFNDDPSEKPQPGVLGLSENTVLQST